MKPCLFKARVAGDEYQTRSFLLLRCWNEGSAVRYFLGRAKHPPAILLIEMAKPTSKSISKSRPFAIAILAAGKGTRLKSRRPKVLHEIAGKPLLAHVVAAASQVVPPGNIFAIIGHEAERVQEALASTGINFVLQREQRGTGHAMMEARDALQSFETVLVLSGDVPLIRAETIKRVWDFHIAHHAAMTMLTAEPADPTGYGRVFRKLVKGKRSDEVERIVEQKSLRGKEAEQREINSGIYAFATKPLYANIGKLKTDNAHHEYYLTDMVTLLGKAGEKVLALPAADSSEVLGVNTRIELAELDAKLRDQKARELMLAGTTIFRPGTLRHRCRRRDRPGHRDRAFRATDWQDEDRRRLPHSVVLGDHQLRDRRSCSHSAGLHHGRFRGSQRRATWTLLASAAGQ